MSVYLSIYVNFNQEPPSTEYGTWKNDCEDWNSPEGANYRLNTNISWKPFDKLSKEVCQFLLELISHENNVDKNIWCGDDCSHSPDLKMLDEIDIMQLELRVLE